jgi:hypothetical protein
MKPVDAGDLAFEHRHEMPGLSVAGIPARHEDGVQAGQLRQHTRPLRDRGVHLTWIAVVGIQCRIPHPDREPVVARNPRHVDHHVHLRQRKVRAVRGIVRPRRHQFDRVGPEDGEITNVLLPHGNVPCVVGIRLWTVAKLVPAQRHLRG